MNLRPLYTTLRRRIRLSRLLQIAVLIGFWAAGNLIVQLTGLPLPGGIVGMVLVLVLLSTGKLRLESMRRGANWFLAEMLLFFTPAVLANMKHPELAGWLGVQILVLIVLGTGIVMIVTALSVDLCCRLQKGIS